MSNEASDIRQTLQGLDRERHRLEARLREIEEQNAGSPSVTPPSASVTNSSPVVEKITLFRRMFGGRTDVFPVRWDNAKTGRSGYAPACNNEWVRGVCGKPQVKCGECPNKAFIPVTANVVECHLRGEDRIRPNGEEKNSTGAAGLVTLLPL